MAKSSKKKSGKAGAQSQPKAVKNGKPEAAKEATAPVKEKEKVPPSELAELKKAAENAKSEFEKAKSEAEALRKEAAELEAAAKTTYRDVVAPYRDACRKAGIECEFTGGRSAPVAPRVRFLLEKTDKGIKVMVKDRPETENVIPNGEMKASVMKAARKYCEEAVGPEKEQGKKFAGLYGRLRKLFNQN
jgi:leucyl aminopeptidase (aminopeptidase T)